MRKILFFIAALLFGIIQAHALDYIGIMKRLFLTILLFLCVVSGRAEFFSATNSQGLELWYYLLSDSTVMLWGSDTTSDDDGAHWDIHNYSYITCDTLFVPEIATYQEKDYKVTQIGKWGAFNYINSLTTIYLPKTLELIGDSMIYSEYTEDGGSVADMHEKDVSTAFINSPNLRSILVDNENPYYTSVDGVLYTKDLKTLIAYPEGIINDTLTIVDGCKHIGRFAVYENPHVKVIDFPNSLKSIGVQAFSKMTSTIRSIFIRDSVEVIGYRAFRIYISTPLDTLHLGEGIKRINPTALPAAKNTYCYAKEPTDNAPLHISADYVTLYVPRQNLLAYQQHPEWGKCKDIRPIEPPIVTGVDIAEVSWVQNFSATGYVWTLYTDEARTQRFMSLTFDANGHLTHIDINSSHMPERMPALYHEDGEEEKRFAEYYSFTISGLSPDTKYYYTRQSLKGTEVIDEETGSFETLSDQPTGLKGYESVTQTPQKFIEKGQVLIRSGKETYNVQGLQVE